ncbi:MAG: Oxidoreductase, short-chain dehydrogenase/reductase family [Myxococcaceae bacterium]|nr:Oxidoreductase, short-chain dehydrogenase/reductase family [Myxococcaceae bacterium]
MKAVVVGASKGIGRAIARALAEQGAQLYLLGRDQVDLARSAADLEQRGLGKHPVHVAPLDLESPDGFHEAIAEADRKLSGIDTVVITAGLFAPQDKLENDLEFTRRMLTVNFANTVVLCEHARQRLIANGGGTLCVVSSVAGERGRKPIVLYGASKAGLSAYLEGLDHKYHEVGLRVVTVKPGFVKTGMTEGLKPPPFAGEPEQVARDVVRAIKHGTPVLYTPRIWALIMFVIRLLPRFIMRKIGF